MYILLCSVSLNGYYRPVGFELSLLTKLANVLEKKKCEFLKKSVTIGVEVKGKWQDIVI